MEHIVQFGITIDDNAIKKTIENNTQQQVINIIKQDVMKQLVEKKECSSIEYNHKIKELIIETTNIFLENNKVDIIEMTSIKLVEKLVKTKAIKDMINKNIESLLD